MKIKNIENDYFISVDNETLDLLERQGEKCANEVIEANKSIRETAFKIFNLLILGTGGSFILLTQTKELNYLSFILSIFCIGWGLITIYIASSCVIRKYRPLANPHPKAVYPEVYKNLNNDDYSYFSSIGYTGERSSLPIFRRYKLGTLQVAIDETLELNEKMANSLNLAIKLSAGIPIAACLISLIYYLMIFICSFLVSHP